MWNIIVLPSDLGQRMRVLAEIAFSKAKRIEPFGMLPCLFMRLQRDLVLSSLPCLSFLPITRFVCSSMPKISP